MEATQVPEVEVTQVPVEANVFTVSENLVDANVPEAVEFGLNESIQYVSILTSHRIIVHVYMVSNVEQ